MEIIDNRIQKKDDLDILNEKINVLNSNIKHALNKNNIKVSSYKRWYDPDDNCIGYAYHFKLTEITTGNKNSWFGGDKKSVILEFVTYDTNLGLTRITNISKDYESIILKEFEKLYPKISIYIGGEVYP